MSGVHIHLEVIKKHRYSCYVHRGASTDLTVVGRVGVHHTGQRQRC
ncbi:hypothetical protein AB0883_15335 [Micromonospora sp. NPDC047812]